MSLLCLILIRFLSRVSVFFDRLFFIQNRSIIWQQESLKAVRDADVLFNNF